MFRLHSMFRLYVKQLSKNPWNENDHCLKYEIFQIFQRLNQKSIIWGPNSTVNKVFASHTCKPNSIL